MSAAPGASGSRPATMAARARDAWKGAEVLLHTLTGRPDLDGQELLMEARRQDKLDMEGMHALVAMREWVERTLAPGSAAQMLSLPPTEAERDVAHNVLSALQRATAQTPPVDAASATLPLQPVATAPSPWAPQATYEGTASVNDSRPTPSAPYSAPPIVAANRATTSDAPTELQVTRSPSWSSGAIMAVALVVVAVVGVGGWALLRSTTSDSSAYTEQGVEAYARGSMEAARIPLAKAVEVNPQDVRALIYLGRIAREQGNLATARKYLETAIRIEPDNALALRELASALLADEQYELARRFYVRALSVDPNDRTSQGFLACSLKHLNRDEEATRWFDRAGTGAWTQCAAAAPGRAIGK